MKRIFFYFFFILILAIVISAFTEFNRNCPAYIVRELGLQEKLSLEPKKAEFRVNFLGFLPVGIAQISNEGVEVYQNADVYHLSAQARLAGFVSRFYSPDFRVDSYIHKERLHPLRFNQILTMPERQAEKKEIIYDQKNNIMELEGVRRQVLPDTQDPLSSIFYIQHQILSPGKEFDINMNTNQKNYRLYAKVMKKEEYKIGNKKIGAWVVEVDIRRRDKNPLHSSTMSLWFLDNPSKTLILIKSLTSIGLVRARLVKIE